MAWSPGASCWQWGSARKEIERRLRTGALIAVFRGVYRVGHTAPSLEAHYLAAVRACGSGALLSGRAAAHLLGMLKGKAPAPEVTARTERRVPGVTTRQGERNGTLWRGIPVTTPAETLVDLAAVVDETELARACHEAGVRHHTTPNKSRRCLARRPNAKGAGQLRAIIRGEVKVTLSKLEERFLERLREASLPLPQTNRPAGSKRVDCRWPDTGSLSSSTVTATTAPATPGSRTAAANGRLTLAATSSAVTPMATSSRARRQCSPSCRALLTPAPSALPSPR